MRHSFFVSVILVLITFSACIEYSEVSTTSELVKPPFVIFGAISPEFDTNYVYIYESVLGARNTELPDSLKRAFAEANIYIQSGNTSYNIDYNDEEALYFFKQADFKIQGGETYTLLVEFPKSGETATASTKVPVSKHVIDSFLISNLYDSENYKNLSVWLTAEDSIIDKLSLAPKFINSISGTTYNQHWILFDFIKTSKGNHVINGTISYSKDGKLVYNKIELNLFTGNNDYVGYKTSYQYGQEAYGEVDFTQEKPELTNDRIALTFNNFTGNAIGAFYAVRKTSQTINITRIEN